MAKEIRVPELGESVLEATVIRWLKAEGDAVRAGEPVLELETDKVNLEVGSEWGGVLTEIRAREGEDVQVGDVLALVDTKAEPGSSPRPAEQESAPEEARQIPAQQETKVEAPRTAEPARLAGREQGAAGEAVGAGWPKQREVEARPEVRATPVARQMAEQVGIDLARVKGSGREGRVTKADLEAHLERGRRAPEEAPAPAAEEGRREERVRMSRRRRTIAERMVEAQRNAAMLTTFNEVDMLAVMELRRQRNSEFEERHGVKLGIASFFIKASVAALQEYPPLNAELDGNEMVLKHYYDIGLAIGDEKGLVVPVLRDVDQMSFAEIETRINSLIEKTRQGDLAIEDLRGGTFTVTNGGVFGSLLSTPILNPPQVAILGLHKIEDRPIAWKGEVQIHPMMYVALSYDHRIVDGREAVQFLVRVKQYIEDPGLLLLEI
jgi:2-oxoglutarate dehydrogenase E2 component (dihydrolipoamide succinyltransferase)